MRLRLRQQRLLELLAASPLSQNHWALKVGLSRGHWSEIVNGKHPYPSAKTRTLMLEAFGLKPADLFDLEAGVEPVADLDFRRAIADRYLIDSELGQGGMGAVYLARDVRHGRVVAVKVISPEAVSGIGLTQFQREISTIAQLHHPNILPLYDSGEAAGHPFFVMPWVRGGSLRGRLERDVRLGTRESLPLIRGMAEGLAHAHAERVLHCDVKPANVLLHQEHAWLMDFGIARKLHSETREWPVRGDLDLSAGTPAYVSPEQAAGEADLDARSDVYSLGCLVFEMLAGRPPFEGASTREVVARRFIVPPPPLRNLAPEVPFGVEAVLERAMALPREKRPATPVELATELEHAATGSRVFAVAGLGVSRLAGRVRRRLGSFAPRPVGGLVRDFFSDVAQSLRGIRRAPGFAAVVVLTLGLALGANATMFGIVDRLLLRAPAHIDRPEEIRRIHISRFFNGEQTRPSPSMSYPAFTDLRGATSSFAQVAAFDEDEGAYGIGVASRQINMVRATGGYFALLGTRPELGRFIGEDDDRVPGALVVVLSHGFWQSSFGADTAVIGRSMLIDNLSYQIIGVAPRGFTGTQLRPVEAWIPMSTMGRDGDDEYLTHRGYQWLRTIARLRPGVSDVAATEAATRAYSTGHAEYREYERRAIASLAPLIAGRDPVGRSPESRVSGWLFAMSLIVLLIACANIANLMVARGLVRRGEVAVRRALGGSRGRLVRQFATESLVLASLGCLAGLAVANWGGDIVRAVALPGTAFDSSPIDRRVLLLTGFCALVAATVAGVVPLLFGSRSNLASAMQGASRSNIGHPRRLLGTLLLAQTSLTTLLLVGAGLFVRSLNRVHDLDMGFVPRPLIQVDASLSRAGATNAEVRAFYAEALTRVQRVPGVVAAGLMRGAPFMSNYAVNLRIPGLDSIPEQPGGGPYYFRAGAGALEALQVRLLRGRLFTAADDRPGAAPVSIVTQRMAEGLWPGRDPMAQCLIVDTMPCAPVVGVIANMYRQGINERAFFGYFLPLGLNPDDTPELMLVRAAGNPDALIEPLRRTVHSIRENLPYVHVESYEETIAPQARSWRLGATMFTAFGVLSLLIAAVGVYGVLSFSVAQRMPELGIRAALGAQPGRVLRSVLLGGIGAAAVGVIIGGVFAWTTASRFEPLLFQTSAREPLVYAVAGGVIVLCAVLASLLPGIRASKADPMAVLRAQ